METVEDVNSPYKLDFYYSVNVDGADKKFNMETVSEFNMNYAGPSGYLMQIAAEYVARGELEKFWSYADDIEKVFVKYRYSVDKAELAKLKEAMKDPEILTDTKAYHDKLAWTIQRIYLELGETAGKNTPEYADVLKAFNEWSSTRPGVKAAYEKFVEGCQDHDKEKLADFSLDNLAAIRKNLGFRTILETSRPLKFKPGVVVKLKDEYANKKGKDPFRWHYDLKNETRVGVVCENKKTTYRSNIGMGSRGINVMWFATGEETMLPERCLETTTV